MENKTKQRDNSDQSAASFNMLRSFLSVCVCVEGDLRSVVPDSIFPYLYCSCGHKTITLKSIILTVTPLTSGELCLPEKG